MLSYANGGKTRFGRPHAFALSHSRQSTFSKQHFQRTSAEKKWNEVAVGFIDKYLGTSKTSKAAAQQKVQPVSGGVGSGVIILCLINYVVFFLDKYTSIALVSSMPLFAWKWHWWQLITYAFCHADFNHLASNMFLLLVFGRQVEEEEGALGLIITYLVCSIGSAIAFLATASPRAAIVGASGAVFGLLVVSIAAKLSQFSFRRFVELCVIAPFVYSQLTSNISAQVTGVGGNISYIGHIGGAATGLVLVTILSLLPAEK